MANMSKAPVIVEIYRALVPATKVVNDNHGQHYAAIQGKLDWLTQQYQWIKDGKFLARKGRGVNAVEVEQEYHAPGGFTIPDVNDVRNALGLCEKGTEEKHIHPLVIHHEIWKLGERRFDPHNYAHTFKAPLDALVQDGYLDDDSWKYVKRTEFVGGGYPVFAERALKDNVILGNIGLPDEFTLEWWKSMQAETNDALIRTLLILE